MIELFQTHLLLLAFASCLLAALSTSILSVFVTLKRISFMSEAFSHISFAGLALAFLIGSYTNVITILFVLSAALLIAVLSQHLHWDETNITVIFLSVSMALGIILVRLNTNVSVDITSVLFGNVLFVTKSDLWQLAVLVIINSMFLILFYKELFYLTYNYEIASVFRIPVKVIYYIFILLIAFNIVITVKIIGVVMVTALFILPGVIALNLTKRLPKAIIVSIIVSVFAAIMGFISSYYFNLPTGSVIVILLFLEFLLSLLLKRPSIKKI